ACGDSAAASVPAGESSEWALASVPACSSPEAAPSHPDSRCRSPWPRAQEAGQRQGRSGSTMPWQESVFLLCRRGGASRSPFLRKFRQQCCPRVGDSLYLEKRYSRVLKGAVGFL